MTPAPAAASLAEQLRKHPRYRLLLRLLAVGLSALFALPAALVSRAMGDLALAPALAIGLAIVVPLAVLGEAWARAAFARYSVHRLADGLLIHRGVWWRSETFAPQSRIQHTEVNQGPLDRRWGMARLIVHTAGTHMNAITVPGLYREDAVALRDSLLGRDGTDAV